MGSGRTRARLTGPGRIEPVTDHVVGVDLVRRPWGAVLLALALRTEGASMASGERKTEQRESSSGQAPSAACEDSDPHLTSGS